MESCSDSMYCFSPKMTTACTPKSAFLWGATQFPDITLPGDCVDDEIAVRLTFFWFLLTALNDLCVFCQNQHLGEDEPSNTQSSVLAMNHGQLPEAQKDHTDHFKEGKYA